MTALLRKSGELPLLLAGAVLFLLMVMTFADVMLRSAFNAPIEAAPELTRMAVAIVVFSVMPVLSAQGKHISVDLLDGVLDRFGLRRATEALVSLACGVMLWWPSNRVADLAERARSYGDVTEFLAVPVHYLTWFIAIATFATMGVLILRGLALIFAPQLVQSDHD